MHTAPPPLFADHAKAVVRALRGSIAEALTGVGADPHDPQSIGKALGFNKNLAWKLAKIVQADDPSVALSHMPGNPGIEIFVAGVQKAGASAALMTGLREAIEGYENLITVHCGDRATLDMLGSQLGREGRADRDEQHRKLLFQGGSYVWGAQVRVNLKLGVVGPGAGEGMLDFASVSGLIDFRRLRDGVSWIMAARQTHNDDGTEMATFPTEPIDARSNGPAGQTPLMHDYCSTPLPELRRVAGAGHVRYELPEGPVGNTGALTCVAGLIHRGIPCWRTPDNRWGEHSATSHIPAELMLVDLFFHKSLTFALKPEAMLVSELRGPMAPALQHRQTLPLHEPLMDLGLGALPVATPEVPRYGAMVRSVFERMAWDPAEFHTFRVKIAYPAHPTTVLVRYELPEKS